MYRTWHLFDTIPVRKYIRAAELEVTCSTHPDNPFPVYNELTSCTDSRYFDSPAERRHFEDVVGVAGNVCIKRGSSLTGVDGQTTIGVFSRPGYEQKYLLFPDVARNKRHAPRVPSDVGNGQLKFGADPIRRYGDIRETGWRRVPSGGNHVVTGEVRKTTTPSLRPLWIRRARAKFGGDLTRRPGDPLVHTKPHTDTDRQTDSFPLVIYTIYTALLFTRKLETRINENPGFRTI